MTEISYEEKMEKKLVTEFKQKFYSKMGYTPVVITKTLKEIDPNNSSFEGLKGVQLLTLKSWFEGLLPRRNGIILYLHSKRRYREIVELRMFYCFIARAMGYSLIKIGESLGNRDHTTIIHNLTTFKNLMETNIYYRDRFETVLEHLKQKSKENDTELLECSNQTQDNDEPAILS